MSDPVQPRPRPIGGTYTFGGRQGRMSPTRERALADLLPQYAAVPPFFGPPFFGPPYSVSRIVVEIGCGKGDATATMAEGEANSFVIACEPNMSMIANLVLRLHEREIDNVRLWTGDAFDLIALLGPASIDEVRVWFPDPWPKARQAGKRLFTAERLAVIVDAMRVGAVLRLATDDSNFAAEALAAIDTHGGLVGGVVARPDERPITVFEARGLREGRAAIDICATRIS